MVGFGRVWCDSFLFGLPGVLRGVLWADFCIESIIHGTLQLRHRGFGRNSYLQAVCECDASIARATGGVCPH